MTREQLDNARYQCNNDEDILRIGYLLYGKYFSKSFKVLSSNNKIIIDSCFKKTMENHSPFKVDEKFEDWLDKNLYYSYEEYGIRHCIIFRNKYIIECIISHELIDLFWIFSDSKAYFLDFIKEVADFNIKESLPKDITYNYLLISSDEFSSKRLSLSSNYKVDLNKNFNDDLPIEEFDRFINKNECGLSLLHGIPGCGKTTFIKNLIHKYGENKEFYVLDASLLSNITNQNFINYLVENSDSIFILEDCEKLLLDRNNHDNPWIGTLLNLTDGMLGESLKIKFICTFNCNLASIDEALLREGRLNILYEFCPLTELKGKSLCKELGRSYTNGMTLAQIYKSKSDSSKLTKSSKKVGF